MQMGDIMIKKKVFNMNVKNKLLVKAVLGFSCLFITPVTNSIDITNVTTLVKNTVYHLASHAYPFNKSHNDGPIAIFHDIEDDLGFVLNLPDGSLEKLDKALSVHANGVKLERNEITRVPLDNNQCKFTFEFPLSALLNVLKQDQIQLLLQTYKDTFEKYIQANINPTVNRICSKHFHALWLQMILKVLKIRIHFSYTITDEDRNAECVSLLALILRKREELCASKDRIVDTSAHYSPLRTVSLNLG